MVISEVTWSNFIDFHQRANLDQTGCICGQQFRSNSSELSAEVTETSVNRVAMELLWSSCELKQDVTIIVDPFSKFSQSILG